jgi:hypothetical protein
MCFLYVCSQSQSWCLAVYWQSVHLGDKPLRPMTRGLFFCVQLSPCGQSPYVTFSPMRGCVCLLWICLVFCQAHITCYWKFFLLRYIQVLRQSRLCKADHVYLTHLMLQRQLRHLNAHKLDCCQVEVSYISCVFSHIWGSISISWRPAIFHMWSWQKLSNFKMFLWPHLHLHTLESFNTDDPAAQ